MTTSSKHFSPSQYRSYLLRLWLADADSQSPWRIALINPKTGERRGFVDFECLVDFLRAELPAQPESQSQDAGESLS